MRIYLDIETLPSLAADARELASQGVKPPGTYKKPESIAQWWEAEGQAAIEDAYRRQALDAASGELCAVGFASDDSEPVSLVRASNESEGHFLRYALAEIQRLLDTATRTGPDGTTWPDEPYFVAHNATFDLGFLWRRCVVHGIRPDFPFPRPSAREGKDYGCTMIAWAGYKNTIGLDRLCRALGVHSPKADGMDGGQVFDHWRAGNHEAIRTYNAADVVAVRECWHRLNFEGVTA